MNYRRSERLITAVAGAVVIGGRLVEAGGEADRRLDPLALMDPPIGRSHAQDRQGQPQQRGGGGGCGQPPLAFPDQEWDEDSRGRLERDGGAQKSGGAKVPFR